tara:strand:- start:26360 stop:27508 length:1149 start_codon:yes stop_codon:yes gene_type:complete
MSSEVGAIRGSTSAKTIRRARARRLARRIALWVGLPTLLAIAYYGFWATPQYESVAVFTVQSNKGSAGSLDGLSALLPGVSSSPRDAMLVREFALSRTMLSHLDAEHGFSEHYRDASADFWSRLDSDASREDVYDYYTDRVFVNYSPDAGTLTLRVRAFTADKAQDLAMAIRVASEKMVNEMSERARVDRLSFIEEQVQLAETRLANARKALLALQVEGHELSPEKSASAVLGVRTELEGELAREKAELSALLSVMTAQAPQVRAQKQKVRSLQGQVSAQNKRLVDEEGNSINTSIAKFEPLLFEKEVAQRAFETALASLEMARMEVLREQRYLVTISSASLPQEATEPRRLWSIATVFAISIALMGIFGMLGAALREHAKY